MESIYFRRADAFPRERSINTLPPLTAPETAAAAAEELAARAAAIDATFGRPDSDSKPGAR